jgi:hypothetical protein
MKSITKIKTPGAVKRRKPNQYSDGELRRMYERYLSNIHYGITQLIDVSEHHQKNLWYMVLQDCLYNQTTSSFLHQMYEKDVFPYEEEMPDTQITPLLRKKLFNAFENLVAGGGRSKFRGVLKSIELTLETGEYK